MDLEMKEEGKGKIEIFQNLPKHLEQLVLPTTIPLVIGNETFTCLLQEFKGKGFSAWYNTFWTKIPTVIKARAEFPTLELRIALLNSIKGTWDRIVQPELLKHYFNLSFTPHIITRAIFDNTREYQTFDIHFDLSFLESLGFDYASLDTFITKVYHKQAADLNPEPFRCPDAMIDAVNDILTNECSIKGKAIMLECKVREILLLALEAISKDEGMLPIALKHGDIEKLERVKELIDEAIPVYPGNDVLCKETFLNEFKLTIGFKFLFKMTPYDYYMQCKMKLGKQLLKKPQHSVEGVAFLLGYDGSSAFIKEFKKMFVDTPGKYKKSNVY